MPNLGQQYERKHMDIYTFLETRQQEKVFSKIKDIPIPVGKKVMGMYKICPFLKLAFSHWNTCKTAISYGIFEWAISQKVNSNDMFFFLPMAEKFDKVQTCKKLGYLSILQFLVGKV